MICVILRRGNSWHVCKAVASTRTLCGRVIPQGSVVAADIPGHEKSCESCLRHAAKKGLLRSVVA